MNHHPTRRLRAVFLRSVGAVALAVATACSTPKPPTVMETPTIVWADGVEPSSPLEDDPLVQAARAGEVGRAMAFNSGDFTISQLTDNVSIHLIDILADYYSDQGEEASIYVGPDPWLPISVEKSVNGGIIETCVIGKAKNVVSYREVEPVVVGPYDRTRSRQLWITVENIDGKLKIVEYSEHSSHECDGSTIPVGFFDPEPVAPEGPITKPVRAPEGWKQGKPRE